jgi:hypothetical protein
MEQIEESKPLGKEKKPRSEKQIEAFKKASAIRDANRAKRKEETKKVIEEKVLQKAVSIKKRQIKKMQVLDEISDDETPMEEIRQIQRAITPPPVRPIQQIQQPINKKPQFIFL